MHWPRFVRERFGAPDSQCDKRFGRSTGGYPGTPPQLLGLRWRMVARDLARA